MTDVPAAGAAVTDGRLYGVRAAAVAGAAVTRCTRAGFDRPNCDRPNVEERDRSSNCVVAEKLTSLPRMPKYDSCVRNFPTLSHITVAGGNVRSVTE